jgi:hypothetical protein
MLITSNFHDYYDNCIGYGGVDKTTVYIRKNKGLNISKHKLNKFSKFFTPFRFFDDLIKNISINHVYYWRSNNQININKIIILFCGKLYPIISVSLTQPYKNRLFFNSEEVFKFLKQKLSKKRYNNLLEGYSFNRSFSKGIKDYFNINLPKEKIIDYHLEYDSPIILFKSSRNNYKIEFNPCLKDYEFYKFIDSFQTFQTLEMFLSNIMVKEKEIIMLDDKTRKLKHGFDKTSFRNM